MNDIITPVTRYQPNRKVSKQGFGDMVTASMIYAPQPSFTSGVTRKGLNGMIVFLDKVG